MFTMESSWYNREIYWEYSGISIKFGFTIALRTLAMIRIQYDQGKSGVHQPNLQT